MSRGRCGTVMRETALREKRKGSIAIDYGDKGLIPSAM